MGMFYVLAVLVRNGLRLESVQGAWQNNQEVSFAPLNTEIDCRTTQTGCVDSREGESYRFNFSQRCKDVTVSTSPVALPFESVQLASEQHPLEV